MSYTLNKTDPTRRERILNKREETRGKGIPLYALKRKADGKYIIPNSGIARGKQQPTLMKQSRRNAMMRRLGLRVAAKDIELDYAKKMIQPVLSGTVPRAPVYGTLTARQLRARVQYFKELEADDAD